MHAPIGVDMFDCRDKIGAGPAGDVDPFNACEILVCLQQAIRAATLHPLCYNLFGNQRLAATLRLSELDEPS